MQSIQSANSNCMFRSVSLALYGTELHHALRFLTALELASNQGLYDIMSASCDEYLKQTTLLVPSFDELLHSALTPSSYVEMPHIYALSAAIRASFFTVLRQRQLLTSSSGKSRPWSNQLKRFQSGQTASRRWFSPSRITSPTAYT